MRVLFVHQNFPGQYVHIAPALAADPKNEVVALGMRDAPRLPGVRYVRYGIARGTSANIHPLAQDFEAKVIRGEAAGRAARTLKAEGFTPDVICGHPGWGELLFVKEVWPSAKLISYVEFFYSSSGADVNFDPEFPLKGELAGFDVRIKNAALLLSFEGSDHLIAPTKWQAGQLPAVFSDRLSVIHDGVNTQTVKPDPSSNIRLGRDNLKLTANDEVITFVNRNLEPYRGYHSFMRALPAILKARPRARAVIVGGNGVSYGSRPSSGRSYKDIYLDEVRHDLDLSRVHFVGSIPYSVYLQLLQISAVHVYLTYPFVLSWSMIESMSAGCVVVASATSPVEEVIEDDVNGCLVDFFSPQAIAEQVLDVLSAPERYGRHRIAARRTAVEQYDLKTRCLPLHLDLIERVANG